MWFCKGQEEGRSTQRAPAPPCTPRPASLLMPLLVLCSIGLTACQPAPPALTVGFAPLETPSLEAVEAWQFYLTWTAADGRVTRSDPTVVRPGSEDEGLAWPIRPTTAGETLQVTVEGLVADSSAQGNRRVVARAVSSPFSFTEDGPADITLLMGLPGAVATLADRFSAPRYGAAIGLLGDGRVALVGGASGPSDTALRSADLLDDGARSLQAGLTVPELHVDAPRVHPLTTTLTARGAGGTADYSWLVVLGGDLQGRLGLEPSSTAPLLQPTLDLSLSAGAPPLDVLRYDFRWNEVKALTSLLRPTVLSAGVTLSTGTLYYCGGLELATPTASTLSPARSCWLYSPEGEGSLSGASALAAPALFHTLTLLPEDEVLIAGGSQRPDLIAGGLVLQASLFSFREMRMREARTLITPRAAHSAVLLSGAYPRVLLTGGYGISTGGGLTVLGSAEYFDRYQLEEGSNRVFTAVGAELQFPRAFHVMSELEDGRILVAGGVGADPEADLPVEIFDPKDPTRGFEALDGTELPPLLLAQLIPLTDGNLALVGGSEVLPGGTLAGESEVVRIIVPPK